MFCKEVWALPGRNERFSLLHLAICHLSFHSPTDNSSIGRFAVLNLMHYSSQSSFLTTSDLGIESSNVAHKEKSQQALF